MGAHRPRRGAGEGGEGLSVSATLFEVPAAEQVAKVAVDIPLAHLDRLFDYRIPGKLLGDARPGVRVTVPFAGQVVDGWLVVELDGFTFHSDPWTFDQDRRRDRELVRRGYTVVRFTSNDVRSGKIVTEVHRIVAARPETGGPRPA